MERIKVGFYAEVISYGKYECSVAIHMASRAVYPEACEYTRPVQLQIN